MNYEKIIKELEAKRKYWETKYKELERTHQDVIKDYEQYCNVASKEISELRGKLGWDKMTEQKEVSCPYCKGKGKISKEKYKGLQKCMIEVAEAVKKRMDEK